MSEENKQEWEQGLRERVSTLLTRQVTPLQSEFEKLEKAFAEIRANIAPNADVAEEDAASLVAHVNQLITEAQQKSEKLHEEQLAEELEKVRADITINVRQTLEADFERRLAQATADAQNESHSQIAGLQSQLAALSVVAQSVPVQVAGTDYVAFKEAVEEIDAQRTQSETLTALIRRAANFAPRIVFFVVKGGDAVGWKATGFENGLNDETVRSLSVPTQAPSMLMQALTNQNTAVALNPPQQEINLILGNFGELVPRGSVAIPLVVRGKAAAVLYADSADRTDDAIQLEAIETLMHVASMGIELLPIRRNAEPVRVAAPAPMPAPEPPVAQNIPAPVPMPSEAVNASMSFDSPSMKFGQGAVPTEPSVPAPEVVEAPVEEPVAKTAELEPPAVTHEEAAPTVQPISASPVQEEKIEPRSIFERIKAGAEPEPELPPSAPVVLPVQETPVYAAPVTESAKSSVVTEIPESTDAPTWMRRLETPEPEAVPAPVPAPEPIQSAPLPPSPPPMQRPSLANWGAKERVSGDLSSTQPMPFQAETPSVKVPEPVAAVPNFNQPSDPPRYAAPSLSVSTAASETEVRAHNDARRFARLLVSEIKLYNAAKVNEGRRGADLYSRLRDEIDRSRKVYDKRVSPTVAAKFDYFYDELVQTLAEGDPSKLGEGCPGPVVVTS